MCIQEYREYTCGCKQNTDFKQCVARLGTNVRCDPVTRVPLGVSLHIYKKHTVEPGKDAMHR